MIEYSVLSTGWHYINSYGVTAVAVEVQNTCNRMAKAGYHLNCTSALSSESKISMMMVFERTVDEATTIPD